MHEIIWLTWALPLAGFVVLGMVGRDLPRAVVGALGVGTVVASAVIAFVLGIDLMNRAPADSVMHQTLWTWVSTGSFRATLGFRLDSLSAVMAMVVAGVGALIHIYSARFMADDDGYARYFAYLNLFVASMLVLVLADNLLLLYLGWEGVGLCSYLLIGFWYRDPANGRAARKAFVVTRVGDAALTVGLFVLFWQLGTLDIQQIAAVAPTAWTVDSTGAVAAAALLFGGAVGKSAQLPLQVWLPDAMAAPTPVSALIHAATMVTAGVYLIARMHVVFELAPTVLALVAVVGALTLLIAGTSALAQRDIKRVLAYSTISQIGYMFLALGVGAWSAAIFHLMTHAFFKSLLFLSAGVVITAMDGEHDIFEMGGLKERLPVAFWSFLIGALALVGFPLVTAGFYSKDLILWRAWSEPYGGPWLWAAGAAGVLITGLYIFRVVFRVFFGEPRGQPDERRSAEEGASKKVLLAVPLVLLAALSVVGGFVEMPDDIVGVHLFSNFLSRTLPSPAPVAWAGAGAGLFQAISAALALASIAVAWAAFSKWPAATEEVVDYIAVAPIYVFLAAGWGFDWVYEHLFVIPYVWLARVNRGDAIDVFYESVGGLTRQAHLAVAETQTGRLRWYAATIVAGTVFILAWGVWR